MKKVIFIFLSFLFGFNIFAFNEQDFAAYSLKGEVIYEVDDYKDFYVVYTEQKNIMEDGYKSWSNFVYFFKKMDSKYVLDGYISVNGAGIDIFEDTKEIIENSFYTRNISSFEEYIAQEFPNGELQGKGLYSKTEWEVRFYENYNVQYLWW